MIDAWAEDWPARFRRIITGLGYEDTYQFVLQHRLLSFGQMFGLVRKEAAAVDKAFLAFAHLEESYYLDAIGRGELRNAVMEACVRSIRQLLPAGWNVGKKCRERRIESISKWPVPRILVGSEMSRMGWRDFQGSFWKTIEALSPAEDWCPEDSKDSTLIEAFAIVWPEDYPYPPVQKLKS